MALQVAAGATIGLAIASRYFMVALIPVLAAVDVVVITQARRAGKRIGWLPIAVGGIAIPVAFLLAVPTLLPMWNEVVNDLRTEARTTHLGADGLSFAGNLWWYLTQGLPQSVEWPLAIATITGIVIILWERRLRPLLLLLLAVTFLIGVSLSALHWHRWLIPILPVLMLAAAIALDRFVVWIAHGRPAVFASRLYVLGALLLIAWTGARSIMLDVRSANANTRLEARTWMLERLAGGSRLLQEPYSAPLGGTSLLADEVRALADVGDMELIRQRGYDYAVASSDIYNRFLADPERYPIEVAFYERLFDHGTLIAEFAPAWYEGGPTIRVYRP